jgi:hypothetical protein
MKNVFFTIFLFPLISFSQGVTKSLEDEIQAERNQNIAVIKLNVDAYQLFNSDESPNILAGNDNLSFISITTLGGGPPKVFVGEEIKNKENYSDLFWGNSVTWIGKVTGMQSNGYKIKIRQIELPPGNCAFAEVSYPGISGIVNAWVNEAPKVPSECITWYAIWFEIENPVGETRVFRLDPWVFVRR